MAFDRARIARAVGEERYERGRSIASSDAWFATRGEYGPGSDIELDGILADVVHAAFPATGTAAEFVDTIRAFYLEFPSERIFSAKFVQKTNGRLYELTESEIAPLYRFFGTMLSSDRAELAEPATRVLREFFDDSDRVDAAWRAVTASIDSDSGWRHLLMDASGPVPERLKLPVIERFIGDPAFHEAIFGAIMLGVFDLYGEIERSTAESLLDRILVDVTNPAYVALRKRLADPKPIEPGWQLLRDGS